MEHGYKVRMILSEYETYSMDTRDDLEFVEQIMGADSLAPGYL